MMEWLDRKAALIRYTFADDKSFNIATEELKSLDYKYLLEFEENRITIQKGAEDIIEEILTVEGIQFHKEEI